MQTFWKWWVRNLALVALVASLAAGSYEAVDWSIALSSACTLALIAKAADTLYRSARKRTERAAVAMELDEARKRLVHSSAVSARMRGNRTG
jgi:hypothetical protein